MGWFNFDTDANIELGTKKSQDTYNYQSTYAPSTIKNIDIQYNIASEGSSISTKKDQAISQIPTITPQITTIPTMGNTEIPKSDSIMDNISDMAIVGIIGFGAYMFFGGKIKK